MGIPVLRSRAWRFDFYPRFSIWRPRAKCHDDVDGDDAPQKASLRQVSCDSPLEKLQVVPSKRIFAHAKTRFICVDKLAGPPISLGSYLVSEFPNTLKFIYSARALSWGRSISPPVHSKWVFACAITHLPGTGAIWKLIQPFSTERSTAS